MPEGIWTNGPTRMLVFDGALTEDQATAIKSIYKSLSELPQPVRRVIAKDLAATYAYARIDGSVGDG